MKVDKNMWWHWEKKTKTKKKLSSIYWNCVVCDGSTVARGYFGQVICPLIAFQAYVSFDPAEGDRIRVP